MGEEAELLAFTTVPPAYPHRYLHLHPRGAEPLFQVTTEREERAPLAA